MKLLFCERNLFMQRDIEDALTRMGIDFRCVSYVFNDPNRDDFTPPICGIFCPKIPTMLF